MGKTNTIEFPKSAEIKEMVHFLKTAIINGLAVLMVKNLPLLPNRRQSQNLRTTKGWLLQIKH